MNYHTARSYILQRLSSGLDPALTYHAYSHTLDVLAATRELCRAENIPAYETLLLQTAALFHDAGFLLHNRDHEQLSCQIVQEQLPRFGYTESEIERICGMIMATRIPQAPQNFLEMILCDADLDYLGRSDFYEIGGRLYQELKTYGVISSLQEWNEMQVRFLEKHSFFTPTNITRRRGQKLRYLEELKEWLKVNMK